MKKFIFLALTLFLAQAGFAQRIKAAKVPQAVKTAFANSYPAVTDIDWEEEKGNYEAEFETAKGTEVSVLFDADGKLLETETAISFAQLPLPVQNRLKGQKVKETAIIKDSAGKIIYEAEVKHKDLLFNEKGERVN